MVTAMQLIVCEAKSTTSWNQFSLMIELENTNEIRTVYGKG